MATNPTAITVEDILEKPHTDIVIESEEKTICEMRFEIPEGMRAFVYGKKITIGKTVVTIKPAFTHRKHSSEFSKDGDGWIWFITSNANRLPLSVNCEQRDLLIAVLTEAKKLWIDADTAGANT